MRVLNDLIGKVKTDKGLDDAVFAGLTAHINRNVDADKVPGVKELLGEYAVAKASLVCGCGDT